MWEEERGDVEREIYKTAEGVEARHREGERLIDFFICRLFAHTKVIFMCTKKLKRHKQNCQFNNNNCVKYYVHKDSIIDIKTFICIRSLSIYKT